MTQPMLSQMVPPFLLEVFYEGRFRLVVTHESGESRSEFVDALHPPIFGIDVDDMAAIRVRAEEICREMEAW